MGGKAPHGGGRGWGLRAGPSIQCWGSHELCRGREFIEAVAGSPGARCDGRLVQRQPVRVVEGRRQDGEGWDVGSRLGTVTVAGGVHGGLGVRGCCVGNSKVLGGGHYEVRGSRTLYWSGHRVPAQGPSESGRPQNAGHQQEFGHGEGCAGL